MVKKESKSVVRPAKKVAIAKGVKVTKKKEKEMEKKAGGSNVGEYKKISKGDFCGPSGNAPEGSYPVNSKKRCKAALGYAHNAPNPSGIKACVKRKCKAMIKKISGKK